MASKATATRSASKAPPKAVAAKAAMKTALKGGKPAGKDEAAEKDEGAADQPLPLLDLSDAAVKKMIKAAKKRG